MKKIRLTVIALMLATFFASSASAADNTLREVFEDAFYGAAIGAVIGGAFMIFTKKPAAHLENLGYGAAIGALGGTAYGLAKSARSLASLDNGKVVIAMPTVIPSVVESPSTGRTAVVWQASILRGTFN
ncbi:MAG TPA: hypothetical protein HPP76_03515 [Desulfuromonadales bacterium]|nr:hypothetical protein [Desulfuromonadales bacterium]